MEHYLIIAHGSKLSGWAEKISRIVSDLSTDNDIVNCNITYSFLDADPDIASSLYLLEKSGAKEVTIIPLFLAPSNHMNFDIPVIIGLDADDVIKNILVSKGYDIYSGDLKIELLDTLMFHTGFIQLIKSRIIQRVNEHKCNSVLLLAHGSDKYEDDWNELISRIKSSVSSKKNIHIMHEFVGPGGKLIEKTAELFKNTAFDNRVLVFGLYIGYGADHIINRNIDEIYENGLEYYFVNPNIIWTNDCITRIEGLDNLIRDIILIK